MIDLKQIELQRGGKPLLDHADLRINPGDKLALVGANGSGKSSLFSLLLGRLHLDGGDISIPSEWRVVHMAQELEASQRTALDFVMDGHTRYRELETKLSRCEDDHEAAHLHAALDDLRAWELPSIAERLLQGLGFEVAEHQRLVSDFSGGWQIRLNLAQALMCPSDLLLLDEPTNHLDLDATLWLEQWLQRYRGTLLLVSHDRDFIDSVCDGVVHLEHHKLFRYSGNYSAFERQRSERLAQQQQAFEKQQLEIAHMQKFVARFKAKASKAKQAQSRVKALERMELIAPAHVDSPFHFRFPQPGRMSDPLLSMRQAVLGYQQPVLKNVSLNIHPGSRLALLGANGQGKSTLVKSLAGEIPMLEGERTKGEHLHIGYFSQHQMEALDLQASPITQMQRKQPRATEREIRSFLGSFNFRGTQAEDNIRHFSGGEKARLALALVVWQKPNLLLLDEPTNHLDLDMCHALTVALQGYEGAMVLISHDRHLISNTADQLYLVNNGSLSEFNGDLDDYRNFLLGRPMPSDPRDTANTSTLNKKQQRQAAAAVRALKAPLNKQIKSLEQKIAQNSAALARLQGELADASLYDDANKTRLKEILDHQTQLKQQADRLDSEWLQVQEELEALG